LNIKIVPYPGTEKRKHLQCGEIVWPVQATSDKNLRASALAFLTKFMGFFNRAEYFNAVTFLQTNAGADNKHPTTVYYSVLLTQLFG
jgi:hypothetical protein